MESIKEIKQNPALLALLSSQAPKEKSEKENGQRSAEQKQSKKKQNPKAYERQRGKGGTKPMSYYLPDSLVKQINVMAAQKGITKSEVVVAALTKYMEKKEDVN